MNNTKYNILIVGNGASASALAKKLLQYEETNNVYITCSSEFKSDCIQYIDIREDDLTGLLKFVLENDINLTIPISDKSLSSDIVSFFQSNGQNIFGPNEKACKNIINKLNCKKFLYKNKAQGTKFAMHSKFSQALEYVKNAVYPIIISSAELSKSQDCSMICTSINQAEKFMEKLFFNNETDILIQEYPYGTSFTVYYFTDGYSAIPFGTVRNFKFENPDKSGAYTDGMGCYSPEYRLNDSVMGILQNIMQYILKNLDNINATYTGIIGIEGVLTNNDNFFAQDLKPFLQNHDARAVLNLCNDNLLEIIHSCINGFFSDEYERINTSDYKSVSVVVKSQRKINIIDDSDIDFNDIAFDENSKQINSGYEFVVTKSAPTITSAKSRIISELEDIPKNDIKYRRDICDRIET